MAKKTSFLKTILRAAYSGWAAFMAGFWLAVLAPFGIFPLIPEIKALERPAYRVVRLWGQLAMWTAGYFYKIEGRENFKKDEAYVVIGNHRSRLDILVLAATLPYKFKVLGKAEVLAIPFIGFGFRYVGIAVKRESKESRAASLRVLRKKVDEGWNILVFPEGTYTAPGEKLSEFRNGSFRMAIETKTPILPMVIEDTSRLVPDGTWQMFPGKVRVKFLPAVSVEGYQKGDVAKLRDQVHQLMEAELTTDAYAVLPPQDI